MALSSDPAPVRRQTCLNASVGEYLVKSSQAILSLEEILRLRSATEAPANSKRTSAEKAGSQIIFISGKGGTGTSSLCTNFAMNIQEGRPDASVVVADLVLPIGSIGQLVGGDGKLNLATITDLASEQINAEYFHRNLPKPESWQFNYYLVHPILSMEIVSGENGSVKL